MLRLSESLIVLGSHSLPSYKKKEYKKKKDRKRREEKKKERIKQWREKGSSRSGILFYTKDHNRRKDQVKEKDNHVVCRWMTENVRVLSRGKKVSVLTEVEKEVSSKNSGSRARRWTIGATYFDWVKEGENLIVRRWATGNIWVLSRE